jgi:hypothetical protein
MAPNVRTVMTAAMRYMSIVALLSGPGDPARKRGRSARPGGARVVDRQMP